MSASAVPATLRRNDGARRVRVDARRMLAQVPPDFLGRLIGNTWTSGSWTYPPLSGWVEHWRGADPRVEAFVDGVMREGVGVMFEVNAWAGMRWCSTHRRGVLLDALLRRWAFQPPPPPQVRDGAWTASAVDVAVVMGLDARARVLRSEERVLLASLADDVQALVRAAWTTGLLGEVGSASAVGLRALFDVAPYLFPDVPDVPDGAGVGPVVGAHTAPALDAARVARAVAYLRAGVTVTEAAAVDPDLDGGGGPTLATLEMLAALRPSGSRR